MSYSFAVSAKIDAKTIEAMVKDAIEKETGRKVKSIRFLQREVSDYADRFSSYTFNGCEVDFEPGDMNTGYRHNVMDDR